MVIALVGAFDRYNYGDVVMPIILKMCIENMLPATNEVEFKFYSLSKSEMEYTGGYNTLMLKDLYLNPCEIVIFVGGEILTSRYTGMYLNVQVSKGKIFAYKLARRLFPNITENRCRSLLGGKSLKPWIIDKDTIHCDKLIYNTVGGDLYFGTTYNNKAEVGNDLKKIDYISVREEASYNSVKQINDKAVLCPDSVILISEVFNDSLIMGHISSDIVETIKQMSKYIVFQVNKIEGRGNVNVIADQLEQLHNKTGLNIVLLPIGYAQGHEDNFILRKVYNKLDMNYVFMPKFNNVYETAYIISNSMLYIGTSLHGAITAISYNIPHMALTTNIKKLMDFLSTWKTTPIICTEICDLSENAVSIINNYQEAVDMVTCSSQSMKKR